MSIDWDSFTLLEATQSFAGGLLIGVAAIWLAFANGKIAGVSGIVGRLVEKLLYHDNGSFSWQLSFIAGLIFAPVVWLSFTQLPDASQVTGNNGLLLGGILVGFGTRLANGCTSGHGVCGLSRLSLSSLIAVISFMSAGFLTVFISKHVLV